MTASRREFVGLVGAVFAWPGVAFGRSDDRTRRIGVLRASPPPDTYLAALRSGLLAHGYKEGRDYTIVPRWGDGTLSSLKPNADHLVDQRVDVIVAEGIQAVRAARKASASIPIVMTRSVDPVRLGLADSLARPGGNVTGLTSQTVSFSGKFLQLLAELIPGLTRVAVIAPDAAWIVFQAKITAAARSLGLVLDHVEIEGSKSTDEAFRRCVASKAQGAVIIGTILYSAAQQKLIVESAARHAVPTIYDTPDYAAAGGLIAYGIDVLQVYRHAADYVAKILAGANPAELPIEQSTTLALAVNLKTAEALGLAIPPAILARADEVFE